MGQVNRMGEGEEGLRVGKSKGCSVKGGREQRRGVRGGGEYCVRGIGGGGDLKR